MALSIVQASNYLVPVIILPYLFRVLGDSRYGLIEFARAVSIYFLTLTDYGFSLSATREVAVHREDPEKVSEIFSAVMLLRFLLVVLSLVALGVLVLGIPRLRERLGGLPACLRARDRPVAPARLALPGHGADEARRHRQYHRQAAVHRSDLSSL